MKRVAFFITPLLLATLAACGSDTDDSPAGGTDAGTAGDSGATDGGNAGTDAGSAAADAGAGDAGNAAADAGSADAGGADAGSADAGGGIDWAGMGFKDRQKYMQNTVEPAMRKLFQEFDSKRYANFGCSTCHGKNQVAVSSKMPNSLPPLDPAKMPDPASANAYEAKFAKFMMQKVVPEMATLLGDEPFDPGTGKGFGCFGCHATKK